MTTERFQLDETRARAWLSRAIAAREACEIPAVDDAGIELPDIYEAYQPTDDWEDGGATFGLVALARDAGIITGPGTVDFDYANCGNGDIGYTWLVRVRCGAADLKLSSLYEDLRRCGDRQAAGLAAAMAVLREAVARANGLLDDLDAYVAARPRAAYVLEWSDDKYGTSLDAYATPEQTDAARADIARQNWGRLACTEHGDTDPDTLSDEDAAAAYFDHAERCGEFAVTHELTVPGVTPQSVPA